MILIDNIGGRDFNLSLASILYLGPRMVSHAAYHFMPCHIGLSAVYGSPLLPSRFSVPAYLKRPRKRADAETKGRENELVFSFSRNYNSTQKLHTNAATRIRTIKSVTFANSCFSYRVPTSLSVSFSRVSYFVLKRRLESGINVL